MPGFEGYFDGEGRPIDAPADEIVAAHRETNRGRKGLFNNVDTKDLLSQEKGLVAEAPVVDAANEALAEGKKLYDSKDYRPAIRSFKSAIKNWPKSRVAEEAQFLIAESNFHSDYYAAARDAYDVLVSEYPTTRRIDTVVDRQWRIAQYWEKYHFEYSKHAALQPNFFDKTRPTFDTIGEAIKAYDSIRLNDPTGPRADDAVMATAGIYFRQEKYEEADYHYTLLRQDYPRSEFQFEAHLLGLQAKLNLYQGPDYDGAPLNEAKKLAKRIRINFAGRLTEEEKQRLHKVDAEYLLQVEAREIRRAKYYDNIQQYGAARQIYGQIVRKYHGSPTANEAATRLAELGGLPAVPEKPLAQFVALVPQNREQAKFSQIPEVKAVREATRLAQNPPAASNRAAPASATDATPPPATQLR